MTTDMQATELNEVFRRNLAERRKELGMSQAGLARKMNEKRKKKDAQVHAPYISDLESGERVPYISTLAELAEALETTPDALLAEKTAV